VGLEIGLALCTRPGVEDFGIGWNKSGGWRLFLRGLLTSGSSMRTLRQRFVLPAAAVLLCQIMAAPGSAQAPAGPGPSDGDPGQGLTSVMSRDRLDSVLGREVRTRVEEDVGRVVDILADRQSRVQAAIIEFGGFLGIGTRKIAVDWSAISFENDGKRTIVIVDLSRDQLRLAPEYKPNEQPTIVRTSD
jgi:hypothetical protein